jgi:mannose-1-phosphate guanylyltransferase
MLLSAGLATRLAPLSGVRPKALFPVLNRPMLRYWLERLVDVGVRRAVVNVHWLPDMVEGKIEEWRASFPTLEIVISREEGLLGTGGGIKNAERHFDGPFFVLNTDIHTDFPLEELAGSYFKDGEPLATLAVAEGRGGTVSVGEGGDVLAFRAGGQVAGEARRSMGLGLMVLSPDAIAGMREGNSDIIVRLDGLIKAGGKVSTVSTDARWSDIGTVTDYYNLNFGLAKGGRYVEEGARILGESEGFLAAEAGAVVEEGAMVENCILWNGAVVESGCTLRSMIVAGRVRSGVKMSGGVITSN